MIAILEDDDSIRQLVQYTLEVQGHEVQSFARPSLFWQALDTEIPELLLLDLMLPEEDGLSVLRKLRARNETARMPVLLVTARSSEYERVLGLDSGADDYITKPFGMMELVARVHAALRRGGVHRPFGEPSLTAGPITLWHDRHLVCVHQQPVTLTLKEFDLLRLFMDNVGIVFTRSQLLDRLWGYTFDGETRTVDVHIRTLRQKLGDAGAMIHTIRGVGYVLRLPQ